jgi:hypothetical protein
MTEGRFPLRHERGGIGLEGCGVQAIAAETQADEQRE